MRSRIQFAFTIAFHHIYPPLSIGLGVMFVIKNGLYFRTKNQLYEKMTKFWVKVFRFNYCNGSREWNSDGVRPGQHIQDSSELYLGVCLRDLAALLLKEFKGIE